MQIRKDCRKVLIAIKAEPVYNLKNIIIMNLRSLLHKVSQY